MSRRVIDGRKFEKKWMQRAKEQFGLNRKGVIKLMKKAGIRNLDSKNDIRGMRKHVDRKPPDGGGGSGNGSPPPQTTQPTPPRGPNTGGGGGGGGGGSYNPYQGAYTSLVDQYNNLYENYTNAQNSAQNAQNQIDRYQSTINDYRNQISGFQNQLSNYQGQVGNLTTQYQNALADNATIKQERDDFEKKFGEQSALYEQARAEADTYREQAVGRQLSGLRSGASAGGANQTSYAGGGNLASGRSGYRSSARDQDKEIADYVIEQGGITDSVLSREGPVVQMMDRDRRPRAQGSASQPGRRTTSAGSGSYYASRFG